MDRRHFLMLGAALGVAGCAPGPLDRPATREEVGALAEGLAALDPIVSAQEALRAAEISFAHTAVLAKQYQITDGPITHNRKVNFGQKPRGLCWHWAEDMSKRLRQENFETLDVTRAIGNTHTALLLEHSTAVLTPKGAPMEAGMVIDPWRLAGRLYWDTVERDAKYKWLPRRTVLLRKQEKREAAQARG